MKPYTLFAILLFPIGLLHGETAFTSKTLWNSGNIIELQLTFSQLSNTPSWTTKENSEPLVTPIQAFKIALKASENELPNYKFVNPELTLKTLGPNSYWVITFQTLKKSSRPKTEYQKYPVIVLFNKSAITPKIIPGFLNEHSPGGHVSGTSSYGTPSKLKINRRESRGQN